MVKPDDDFDDDFEDDDIEPEVSTNTIAALMPGPNQTQNDTRRKIEDILEARRLKKEFGEPEL